MAADPMLATKRLKNWNSAQHVVSHATNSALETCKACASEYDRKKAEFEQIAITDPSDVHEALVTLDRLHAASYWKRASLTCRFGHLASCNRLSQDVRDLAKTRLQKKKTSQTSKSQKQDNRTSESLSIVQPEVETTSCGTDMVGPELRESSEQAEVKVEEDGTFSADTSESQQVDQSVNRPIRTVSQRAPHWSHKHLVSFHPTRPKYETCTACLDVLLVERIVLQTYLSSDDDQEDALKRLHDLDIQIENMYWSFTSHGRMAHLADCLHQTPETRANAALRRDARNRWKGSYPGDAASVPVLQHTDLFHEEGKPLSSEYEAMGEVDNDMEEDYKPLTKAGPREELAEILLTAPLNANVPDTKAYMTFSEDEESDNDNKDLDYIEAYEQEEGRIEECIQEEEAKAEAKAEVEDIPEDTITETVRPAKTASWQSSYLTVKHPDDQGKEGCKACIAAYTDQLELALAAQAPRSEVQAIKAKLSAVYWRALRTRYVHLANCFRQPANVREKARVRVNAAEETQRRSDEKRAKRELEESLNAQTVGGRKKRRTMSPGTQKKGNPVKQSVEDNKITSNKESIPSLQKSEGRLPTYFVPTSMKSIHPLACLSR